MPRRYRGATRGGLVHGIVVGSGVAGLGIAELLVRNGWHVTLMERDTEIGGDASRRTQDWWHTGWLYAGMPDASAQRGCGEALGWHRALYGEEAMSSWRTFSDMLFAYATDDLVRGANAAWRAWVSTGPLRRMRQAGMAGEEIEPPEALAELMRMWEQSEDGTSRYRTIRTTDGGIDTARVMRWLADRLGDADVVTGAEARLTTTKGRTTVRLNGFAYSADLVVVAAGSGTRPLLAPIDPVIATCFTSVGSPIAVVPEQPWPAFIRYTANLDRTVNHVPYPTPFGTVSTLGSYDELGPGGDAGPFLAKIRRMMPFPEEHAGVYIGTKTEYTRGRGRRYNHAVVPVNGNTVAVVPGKFSQFPLLVADFARQVGLGLRLDRPSIVGGDHAMTVGPTEPERIAQRAMLAEALS
ncbi:MAG: FAD-dependent oxidoreductase [Limnohabitans sp.]